MLSKSATAVQELCSTIRLLITNEIAAKIIYILSMEDDMNTHKILDEAGYTQLANYPDIARFAASFDWHSEEKLLENIEDEFGPAPEKLTMQDKLPYLIWGGVGSDIDYGAIEQMNTVTRLPVTMAAALMPDAHQGYAMPIGGVAALHNAVSPSFVGYDIACRVSVSILAIDPDEFERMRPKLARDMQAVSSFGKGSGFQGRERRDHEVMYEEIWLEFNHLRNLRGLALEQLGSSGGGNHFFDALVGEVLEETPWLPLGVGDRFIAIMTHSGSRGVGHKMATYYTKLAQKETRAIAKGIPTGYEWLFLDTDAGREYWTVMQLMGRYAQANHQLIHELFLNRSGLSRLAYYENHHNFAWVDEEDSNIVIHRKGATPAGAGVAGIIPGTSGTPSYIVEGLGNPDSLHSSSHGAGRPHSRTEAKKRHDQEFFDYWMSELDVMHFGLAPDETFMAYKDINRVMDLQQDLVRPVAKLIPRVVIMGGKSDDGD